MITTVIADEFLVTNAGIASNVAITVPLYKDYDARAFAPPYTELAHDTPKAYACRLTPSSASWRGSKADACVLHASELEPCHTAGPLIVSDSYRVCT